MELLYRLSEGGASCITGGGASCIKGEELPAAQGEELPVAGPSSRGRLCFPPSPACESVRNASSSINEVAQRSASHRRTLNVC